MAGFISQRWSQQYLSFYILFWIVILPFPHQEITSIYFLTSIPSWVWEDPRTVLTNKIWRKRCHTVTGIALSGLAAFSSSPWEPNDHVVRNSSHVEKSTPWGTINRPNWAPRWQPASSASHPHEPSQTPSLVEPSDDCSRSWQRTVILEKTPCGNRPTETSQSTEPWRS